MNEFISPNWHPAINHFPLGLLGVGVLLELLGLVARREGVRFGARWMILIGSLLVLPTFTAGLYAFRDVVLPGATSITLMPWPSVVQQSPWQAEQWAYISRHIWLNSVATGVFLLVTLLWLASSDRWRRLLYAPLLLLLVLALAAVVVGSWYGGELVYRHGVGQAQPTTGGPGWGDLKFYLPPLQLHATAAGLVLATAVAALALGLRSWHRGPARAPRGEHEAEPPRPRRRPTHVAWLWLLAGLLGLGTAVAGAWSVMGTFTGEALRQNLRMLGDSAHLRLLLHVIFGVLVVVLPLVLAGLMRLAAARRRIAGMLMILLLLVAGMQIWLGIAMLYDGHSGPVFGFNTTATGHVHPPGGAHPHQPQTQPQLHEHEAAAPTAQTRPAQEHEEGHAHDQPHGHGQ